jgi:ribosomal protein L37AE/L43A
MPVVQCERCGYEWSVSSRRGKVILCASCRARRVQTISAAVGKCFPWGGRFAGDETTPVDDDGKPMFPGVRSCGNNDCVNVAHVIGYEKG